MGQCRTLLNSCRLRALFPLMMQLISWAVFSFISSLIHATAVTFPGNSVLFQMFSPKSQPWGVGGGSGDRTNASQKIFLELQTASPNPGNFSDSIEAIKINGFRFHNCPKEKVDRTALWRETLTGW